MKKYILSILIFLIILNVACGTRRINHYKLAEESFYDGNYELAAREYEYVLYGDAIDDSTKIEKENENAKKALTYTINLGNYAIALYRAGYYEKAKETFELCLQANKEIHGFTETTLKGASRRKYRFSEFEIKMIHWYLARIYWLLGDWEGNMIELRNINDSEDKTFSLAHYSMGTMYNNRDRAEAMVFYRMTLDETYDFRLANNLSIFPYAYFDLGLLYAQKGIQYRSDAESYLDTFLDIAKRGENYNLAYKVCYEEYKIPRDWGTFYLIMDLDDDFVNSDSRFSYAEIYIDDNYYGETYLLEDLISQREKIVLAKATQTVIKETTGATTRYATRKAAKKYAEEQGGKTCGVLAELLVWLLLGDELDVVETREFNKIPHTIHSFKTYLPPGAYTIKCKLLNANGYNMNNRTFDIKINPNKLTILEYDPRCKFN